MDSLHEIIQDTCNLVRQSAHPRRGTLSVSPEVAAMLEALNSSAKTLSVPAMEHSEEALHEQREIVSACTRCTLSEQRTQTVFGEGNPNAEVVFVGEGPGAEEDRQGVPFVGDAGKVLTDIIVKGMKLSREDVYICNVVKCRPPKNRNPEPDEIAACSPYLFRQLDIIRPKVICALGAIATMCLLNKDKVTIKQMRGTWHWYQETPVRVTYHPSYLVRSKGDPEKLQDAKRKVWSDIQAVMRVLDGHEQPKR